MISLERYKAIQNTFSIVKDMDTSIDTKVDLSISLCDSLQFNGSRICKLLFSTRTEESVDKAYDIITCGFTYKKVIEYANNIPDVEERHKFIRDVFVDHVFINSKDITGYIKYIDGELTNDVLKAAMIGLEDTSGKLFLSAINNNRTFLEGVLDDVKYYKSPFKHNFLCNLLLNRVVPEQLKKHIALRVYDYDTAHALVVTCLDDPYLSKNIKNIIITELSKN